MKAFSSLLTFSLGAALALGFSACDDDDDDDAPDGGIAGASGQGGSGGGQAGSGGGQAGQGGGEAGSGGNGGTGGDAGQGGAGEGGGGSGGTSGPANDLCKDAADLQVNRAVSGTTVNAAAEYDDENADVFYKVTIDKSGWYQFILTPPFEDALVYMELWKSCAMVDEGGADHPDYIDGIGNQEEPDESAVFNVELEPGTYILVVNAALWDDEEEEYVSGSDFTVEYRNYRTTRPEITSVQAAIGQETQGSNQLQFIALRVDGWDEGKDIWFVSYALLDENDQVIDLDIDDTIMYLDPRYEVDGQFKDAFAGHVLTKDLSAVASARVWLIDVDEVESEPKTVQVSRDYVPLMRNAGETCDLYGHATVCVGELDCDYDENDAAVCRESENPFADKMCK